MRKINETFEDKLKRTLELAGVKPITESKGTSSTILSVMTGKDGKNYGIVKEEGSYYIKNSLNEGTLDYIGGIKNKHNNKYKYDSYAHASRNLNMMMIELNESFGPLDERLSKDMGQEENGPTAPLPGEGGEIPQPAAEPQMPAEPAAPAPQAEPQPEMPAPAPEAPAEPAPAPASGEDADLDGPVGGEESQIDHYVGKLTYEIRNAGDEMNPDKIKSIMNSMISALPLEELDPDSLLELAKRVKHPSANFEQNPAEDGLPTPEAPAAPAPQPQDEPVDETITIPMDEIIAPLEKPTAQFKDPHDFNKEDDKKVNEFFANIKEGDFVSENSQVKFGNVLIEAVDNNLVFKSEDKTFSFNISEETLGKFKGLIK